MKALVLLEVGQKAEVRDVHLREPGRGEVKVRIAASGVCHSALSVVTGTIPIPPPVVLGDEGAGVVTAVGDGVTSVREGDHVVLSWTPVCGVCYFCVRGESNLCSTRRADATPTHFLDGEPIRTHAAGTMAEETIVSEDNLVVIPKDVPLDIAALLGCGVMTGAGAALNTAKVQPGSTVIVFGCGGLGINTIQAARVCGAAVIMGVDRVPSKLENAKLFGATHAALPEDVAELSRVVTDGIGFDYSFEVVGHPETMRAAYDAARRGGTAVIVGVGRRDEFLSLSAFEIFSNEKKLLGSLYGSANVRRDFIRLLNLWRNEQLDLAGLISHRIALEDVNDAFDALTNGSDVIRQVVDLSV